MTAIPLSAVRIVSSLAECGFTHVVTVPDTNQKSVLDELARRQVVPVIRAATEDDVMGICAGLWLAGQQPMALIQQLGLFASVNALRAFGLDQGTPLAILAGLYGRNVERPIDQDQPSAVRYCVPLLNVLEIDWILVEGPDDAKSVGAMLRQAFEQRVTRVVLLGAPTT
jgi:sulfopyruvate decarboxylase subunit alpha